MPGTSFSRFNMAKDTSPPWATRRGHLARRWFSDPVLWTTTALVAIDAAYYVRVMGLGGTSDEQRSSALALAEDVAARTKPIK